MEAFLCDTRAEERSLTAEPGFGRDPERGLLSSGTRLIAFGGADASMWHQTGLPGKHVTKEEGLVFPATVPLVTGQGGLCSLEKVFIPHLAL